MMKNSATNKVKQARHCDHNLKFLRILLCVVIGVLSLVLGVTVGYTQRTPNFNLTSSSKLATTSRIVSSISRCHESEKLSISLMF